MSTYFTQASLKFLRGLARNNERSWFHTHKPEYEAHVRQPFQRLLADLQPDLAAISPHFRSDPKTVGGSLFRIHRDTRYTNDKSPYKPWQGARLYHERFRQTPAPSFYMHLQPGNSFVGGGVWHPEPEVQRRIRQFIFDNPGTWEKAARRPALLKKFEFETSEMLVRPPRGYPPDFEFIDDLRHRNWVLSHTLDDAQITGPRLRSLLAADIKAIAPFMDYLCAALDLEF
ncbi:MAG: DUF2461 domain-containing protein [Xanthomonadaceae bacterium]|jgi:uncharacterized protein (TIGR02453 family)|nr:DUF2461 domain-containing protein [Xanthomonadaceae bacterium]